MEQITKYYIVSIIIGLLAGISGGLIADNITTKDNTIGDPDDPYIPKDYKKTYVRCGSIMNEIEKENVDEYDIDWNSEQHVEASVTMRNGEFENFDATSTHDVIKKMNKFIINN